MNVLVVIGTARKGRQSEKVARAVTAIINEASGRSAELVDVKDHVSDAVTVPPWGVGGANENPTRWSELVAGADALVLIVPEYNHSYPGELKLLLDSLSEQYRGKPVGIVGVSGGILGGARVIDHIKPVLIELGLHPIRAAVNIFQVEEAFNADGSLHNQKTRASVEKMVTELTALATQLRQ